MARSQLIRCPHCGLPHDVEQAECPRTGLAIEVLTAIRAEPVEAEPRSLIGTTIEGGYEITELLGRGSMGNVYLAHNPRIQRDVAIKLLRRVYGDSIPERGRFLREARATGRIEHDNIVQVWDAGVTEEGLPFIVMEVLSGESLADRIARKKVLPLNEIVLIWKQILLGLEAAHQAGVVHRDVKPENVVLTRGGAVKLVDFGIALLLTGSQGSITETGDLMGTPGYLSPEQAHSLDVDHLSDAWSATVVLFEMLTGELPFRGRNAYEVLTAALADEPPTPSSMRPDVLSSFDALIRIGLAKDPKKRADVSALLASLRLIEAQLTDLDFRKTARSNPVFEHDLE